MLSDQESEPPGLGKFLSQCTFWCSVLSDYNSGLGNVTKHRGSQCTFWCSVLSDWTTSKTTRNSRSGLNAPSGAQCFPTLTAAEVVAEFPSQCTFWCSVLSDEARGNRRRPPLPVSMHLLVLSAFRPAKSGCNGTRTKSFNAPSGAQCFPTNSSGNTAPSKQTVSMHLLVLSAFRRKAESCSMRGRRVSMHLLVLSAFRPDGGRLPVLMVERLNAPSGAQCFPTHCRTGCMSRPFRFQCTFWCSVLSDPATSDKTPKSDTPFQCTFWFSVLSDIQTRKLSTL